MANIQSIHALQILDSRGIPTIRGHLILDDGREVTAEVPAGKSVSKYEPVDLRDGDMEAYEGLGVMRAVDYINSLIGPKLVGADATNLLDVDHWLLEADGSQTREKLGANTMLVISMLMLKAGALTQKQSVFEYCHSLYTTEFKIEVGMHMPAPIVNIINGGTHGSPTLDFQEFHIIPATNHTYPDALQMAATLYHEVEKVLEYRNVGIFVSQQGGFSPHLLTNVDALEVIKEAISKTKVKLGVDVFTGLDCAASSLIKDKKYYLKDKQQGMSADDLSDYYSSLATEYSILLIEDPFAEDSFGDWQSLTSKVGSTIYIAGDDLISGNKDRLKKALDHHSCNSVVIKTNQYATITELMEAAAELRKAKVKSVFSQRFGETTDDVIADIAVALGADFVKFGSPNRGERVVKYNRLLEIDTLLRAKGSAT